ncbi:atherin [Nelusetta ayraudi]|uniref:atherin n=1 Tax=Nelusetta ayraudi TaxID=303726 RepID=UPI003F7293D5
MSEPSKYREWILQTIDSLRSRKARPDLERICRMVRRRHGSDPERTRAEMEKLIHEQAVLKVSYKGSISYRNAAKVQRKSRKKTELAAVVIGSGVGGGGAQEEEEEEECAREHEHLHNNNNKNGDSAQHSCSDQEEGLDGEDDSELIPGPFASTAACRKPGEPPASGPGSSSGSLGGCCGAATTTTSCDRVESGCKEEEANVPRDTEGFSGQQGAALSPGPEASKHRDAGGGGEAMELSPSGADSHEQTCSRSAPHPPLPPQQQQQQQQQQRARQATPAESKVRPGAGGTRAPGSPANSEPGDGLVAPARSTKGRPCTSSAALRGHMKPLGLKEILGYLSSQERLSEETLTRGKVKAVMEREVAGGRLRRTRCGNITLPPRGAASGRIASQEGLRKQEEQQEEESELMETGSEQENEKKKEQQEEEEEEEEQEEQGDPQSSAEDGGLSLVAMTTKPQLVSEDAGIQTAAEQQTPPQCSSRAGVGADLSGSPDPATRGRIPFVQGSLVSHCNGTQHEEGQTYLSIKNAKMHLRRDGISNTSKEFNGVESRGTEGESSCLQTPTSSPTHGNMSRERSDGCIKCEVAGGSPLDWTVSDVVSYFTAAGFPEQAAAFRTQEIDGKSLLLMQRNDVLTGLSIRLGPALKIYERHVKALQRSHFEEDDC